MRLFAAAQKAAQPAEPELLTKAARSGRNVPASALVRPLAHAAVLGPCFTSKGSLGRCTSFRECYPYFKLPDLGNWETWILGMYDTCSYFTDTGRQVSRRPIYLPIHTLH